MKNDAPNLAQETKFAKSLCRNLPKESVRVLKELLRKNRLSLINGDVIHLEGRWYVTHSGLLRLANRRRCVGIHTRLLLQASDPATSRWVFKAMVFKSPTSKGFVGYGDADPSNVSPLVRGAEMRVAETRAANRALRKAYGIGICSVEEIGSLAGLSQSERQGRKLPPQPANGAYRGPKLRDRLCQLIRQYQLDPNLVKSYAVDFCGTTTLREATREQVEKFLAHLSDWAQKDRSALLCRLNSYLSSKETAA
jgi:hypothetical protein